MSRLRSGFVVKKIAPVLILNCLAGCNAAKDDATIASDRVIPVSVSSPVAMDVNRILPALGTVESIQSPTVVAETQGRIIDIEVAEGDEVDAGDVMVVIDNTLHAIETAKAAAELKRQDALVENQAMEVERLTRLAKTRAVSEDQLEDEESQLKVLQGQRDVVRKQLELARYNESRTQVLAPIAGRVANRHVSVGDYVSPGQPLFGLVEIDVLRARLAFPEHHASLVTRGKTVFLDTPAAPGNRAEGTVTLINPQVAASNRALEVIVEFPNPGGWLPGSSVDARLVADSHPAALTVPQRSISRRNGRDAVFVVSGDRVQERQVETGWREQGRVEILSGITADEVVVLDGIAMIADGSQVSVESTQP